MAPSWAWARGSPDKAELGFGPWPLAADLGRTTRALEGTRVHPEEVGDNPPECRIPTNPGRSRDIRRSDSLAGINGSTRQLYKVRSL